ncbi:MAG: zinc ribbon domain-containing protein YjdM [Helicobacteraceae bacterium]|jgi:protein PhnA|nr:zinc ribbon domain-containing protein YjdM [Helicobacteraceae bacterium]
MEQLPNCPECGSEYTYEDGELYVCPECAHEWSKNAVAGDSFIIRDANGTPLEEGDMVTVIKDLKVKGASSDVKIGTKFKVARLLDKHDHNMDCKIPGFGAMQITAAFVKKA